MIVDDEEEIVAFMGRFLKRLNIDSVLATSGEDALEKYNYEVIKIQRRQTGKQSTPCSFLSEK